MRYKVLVMTVDATAAQYHANMIAALFGDLICAESFSVKDLADTPLPQAHLYCITTDALEVMRSESSVEPEQLPYVEIGVTFTKKSIELLEEIPPGTTALFVNISEKMAGECITQLIQLGVTHIQWVPYFPGASNVPQVSLAVTPDERRYVPATASEIIDLKQREMDCTTIVEIALKLRLYPFLEGRAFRQYLRTIASNSYGFDELFSRSLRLESGFQSLIDLLDIGIIGVNEQYNIFVKNKKAERILGEHTSITLDTAVTEILPWLPVTKCIQSKTKLDAQLFKINNAPITVQLAPIVRNHTCMGAIVVLQSFNEEELRQHKVRHQLLEKGHKAKYHFSNIIGCSKRIKQVKTIAQKMATTRASILITGESGTGKELFAHSIHNASPRKEEPFVAINCAALPENLLESELFGYADGAFTGAKKGGKMGLFEFAHKGTFFLDEVEGMSPMLQVKLLRAIQEREVMRIGDDRLISVDVRIVAASNENLEQMVREGTFRSDLYYRLCTLPVCLPPLRERPEDIPLLFAHFQKESGGHFILHTKTQTVLSNYQWQGNVRELYNCVEYLTFLDKDVIMPEDLPPSFRTVCNQEHTQQVSTSDHKLSPVQCVLHILAETPYRGMGRETLIDLLAQRGVSISEYELRKLLHSLHTRGLITVTRGRTGNQITRDGLNFLGKTDEIG